MTGTATSKGKEDSYICGIFGWSFAQRITDAQSNSLATALIIFNEERGEHSWGYADLAGVTCKGIGPISAHVTAEDLTVYNNVMVHTRFKTHGEVSLENAHPFTMGPVTGAHNGCLWNDKALNAAHGRAFEVDSMHIFAHLAEGKDLSELVGYGAVEYVDTRMPNNIFLGTFASGELAIARIPKYGIVWSSNKKALKTALVVAGIKQPQFYKVTAEHLYAVKNGHLTDLGPQLPVGDWYGMDTTGSALDMPDGLDDYAGADFDVGVNRYYGTETSSLAAYYKEREEVELQEHRIRLVEDVSARQGGKRTFYLDGTSRETWKGEETDE